MKKFLSIMLSLAVILATSITVFASTESNNDETVQNSKNEIYDIVGSAEWARMDRVERAEKIQLSAAELQSMSTEEIIRIVLDYPFFVDILAFNTLREGFLRVLSESMALQELISREDVSDKLLETYADTPVVQTVSPAVGTDSISDLWKLEVLLAQPEIANKMNELQINVVFETAEEKYKEKLIYSETYSGLAPAFYESVQENSGIDTYAYASYVKTPKGSNVEVIVWQSTDGDFSAKEKEKLHNDIIAAYPNVTKQRDATVKYNCHSYAWYSQSASNTYWMNYPSYFITDGSYTEVGKLETVVGDRIVYYDTNDDTYSVPTHSAIIRSYKDYPKSRRTFVVDSKWGNCGMYRHDLDDSPYYYINKFPCDIKYFH